jgi:hypothetical protein
MEGEGPSPGEVNPTPAWLAPIPATEDTRRKRHTNVSKYPRYNLWGFSAAYGDAECTKVPRGIPRWVLPIEETHELFSTSHGTAPDLIYAWGVPDFSSSDPTSFTKKQCAVAIIEIGFCRDFGSDIKLAK